MTDDARKTPVDQALDLFLYLPVGFVFELPRSIPRFIDRGRRELHAPTSTGPVARLASVTSIDRWQAQAEGTLRALGVGAGEGTGRLRSLPGRNGGRSTVARTPVDGEATTPGFAFATLSQSGDDATASAPAADDAERSGTETGAAAAVIDADALAVPGYDSLSASQVMPRLESLTAPELEQVRQYEHANRGRKTILNKIAQIQAR